MASLLKIKSTRKIPVDGTIVEKSGQRFVRFKRNGKFITRPLAKCGTRFKDESKNWYIQYRDARGVKRRVSGYTDKEATRQLAADLERKVERKIAGLSDPFEDAVSRPLAEHLSEFKAFLADKGDSEKHVDQTYGRIKRCFEGCRFVLWCEISSSKLVSWLSKEREAGRIGIKTSNYYQSAVKEFCNWMVKDQRAAANPINHLSALNSDSDIRRRRRAVSDVEFSWLLRAAARGPAIQCVSGPDRVMLYTLATWTGYRRKELASLSISSFDFEAETPSVQVSAAYSKRKRNDSIPLHPNVLERLKAWLAEKSIADCDVPLFNLRAPGGSLRATSKMMKRDLGRARQLWIEDAENEEEKSRREKSDFLTYENDEGLFADFHANRHTFITNLGKAGVSSQMAQTLARHSDPKLTMNIYTHIESSDQAKAIQQLAPPPVVEYRESAEIAGATVGHQTEDSESVAPLVAPAGDFDSQNMSLGGKIGALPVEPEPTKKPSEIDDSQGFFNDLQPLSSNDASSDGGIRTPDTRIMIPLL